MPPRTDVALKRYRNYSRTYDREQKRNPGAEAARRRVIERLALQPGDVALDVGCGTGLNFEAIESAIGPQGRIIGIDLSPDMLAQARERIDEHGWTNVTLIESAIDTASIPEPVDAVLFCMTHDILQTPAALDNVFAHTKPGARVASLGYKWAPWWTGPWNYFIWNFTRYAITTRENFSNPWRPLERFVPDLQVETMGLGSMYVAWGKRNKLAEASH
jgi:demethylmenaquinone methyltransferase/2-methoxy-6-polyprenyl-1,4-benzoquinol methylase